MIESARTACFNRGQRVEDHFVEVTDMVEIGSGAQRPLKTIMMSRHSTLLPKLLAVGFALAAGLYPAAKVSTIDSITALRYE